MDLSLVPIQDLQEEIVNRFDHVVITCRKDFPNEKKFSRRWKGDYQVCVGLCWEIASMISDEKLDKENKIDPKEL